jgi:hypothetical protein
MPGDPSVEELRASFTAMIEDEGRRQGLSADTVRAFGLANPLGMSADGLVRYWRKVRMVNG